MRSALRQSVVAGDCDTDESRFSALAPEKFSSRPGAVPQARLRSRLRRATNCRLHDVSIVFIKSAEGALQFSLGQRPRDLQRR
jgi:hypothetical protein